MDTSSTHKPELPGVHTYTDDLKENAPKKTFGGILFTTPESTLETVRTEKKESLQSIQSDSDKLFDVGRAFDDKSTQEGIIVTDKKHERRSMGKLLKAAFTEWWDTTQDSVLDVTDKMEFLKPKETPTVIAPKERTNTILEAAQYAQQAPRDDHSVVLKKIRTFAHDAETVTGKPFTVREEAPTEPVWIKEAQEKKVAREEIEKPRVISHPQPTLDLRASVIAPDVTTNSNVSLASYGNTKSETVKTSTSQSPQQTDRALPERNQAFVLPKVSSTDDAHLKPLAPIEQAHKDVRDERVEKKPPVPETRVPTPKQTQLPTTPAQKNSSSWTFFKEGEDTQTTDHSDTTPDIDIVSRPPVPNIQFEPRVVPPAAEVPENETPLPSVTPVVKTPPPKEIPPRPQVSIEKKVPLATLENQPSVPIVTKAEVPPPPKVSVRPQTNVSLSPVNFEYEEPGDAHTATAHFEAVSPKIATHRETSTPNIPFFKIAFVTGIIITGTALGIFAAYFFKSPFPETEIPPPVLAIPTFLNTDAQIAVPLTTTPESFLGALTELMTSAQDGLVQYYPITPIEGAVATTDTIMETLSPQTSGSFIRALSPYSMFGFTSTDSGKEPYMILQSQNFDVVFAGMLAWEPRMSEDLSPFFGTPVIETLLPDGTKTPARFTDALRSNRSIRILYDETGTERIVYAFMNKNLILITTTTEALTKLIERIR